MNFKDLCFIAGQYLLPHHFVSRIAGFFADSEVGFIKRPLIKYFLQRFQIDLSEAERSSVDSYASFNDFFTRTLKAGARPIEGNACQWVSPVDAAISQFGTIDDQQLIQAKGKTFNLTDLLGGDSHSAQRFSGGQFITLYLSPKDYHRIHMPLDAKLTKTTFIPGKLFSVNPLTASHVDRLFARNERLVCEFESEQGNFIMVLVGAMVVASIETTWAGIVAPFQRKIVQQSLNSAALSFSKGEEIARFRLGSTVIMAFEKDQMQWSDEIALGASVKVGAILCQ